MTLKIINIIILIFMPFLFAGIINRTKAFWSGRKGAPVMQPLYDFIKLLKKNILTANVATPVFSFASSAAFSSVLFAALFVPMAGSSAIINIEAGFVVMAYILAFGKYFSIIGAMDTGSSFEGMGSSREVNFTSIIEPAFFIIFASIILLTGHYNLSDLLISLEYSNPYEFVIIILTAISFFVILITEGSRVPVDDPNTHLELTMIHEVMVLDNSGAELALFNYASYLKMMIFASLAAAVLIPPGLPLLSSVMLFIGIIMLIAVIIGTLESSVARLRNSHVFEFVFVVSSFALIILSLAAIKLYGI